MVFIPPHVAEIGCTFFFWPAGGKILVVEESTPWTLGGFLVKCRNVTFFVPLFLPVPF